MDSSEQLSKKRKTSDDNKEFILKQYIKTAIISQIAIELDKSLDSYIDSFEVSSTIQCQVGLLSDISIATAKEKYNILCLKELSNKHQKLHTTEINDMLDDFIKKIKEDILSKKFKI